ncbi:UDP-N-acetylglucosamine 2-epimerase [Caldithrix abyssi DSM 13497]|uniref:UDP-N-acetylglucosamine 2-epimerase n=1 Tax=Caldithrix abyssi DSM 13497 TaxID=880073 RepID=H1XS41_CALAY|nr:UDP-N-acetylglucosamine 2-epimerase (non-hydrolyzing) [Caldithrix abyssi]APF20144.1 UDP-N-acetylglucosamine 2-epimerase (non-hydrolysing) [Caldithrix abyssi DSM 13497]EHO40205.1 UDP-N-acetylglucosamine 2-epimerase [Caldithrix abyssi DSM 13497]
MTNFQKSIIHQESKISKLKVMTFVGTRPEIIRLSATIKLLDQFVNHILVHTGQNYDYELNEIFFKDLDLRKPDYFLNVDISSLGAAVGDIIKKSEEVLIKEKPDAVLVLGDTNSCLAAYMAKRMHIPIYHMEAGNRCFDFNVPEEINRRIIDHIADFNLVYTEHARRHLLTEGLPHRRIYLTGSPMFEVLQQNMEKISNSKILNELKLERKKYFIVSVHREENVDYKTNLQNIIEILNLIVKEYDFPVIVTTHPRTRKRMQSLSEIQINEKIKFLKPFGFSDYVHLQMHALCTISDSGTISEESAILNFPAITLRNSMERPEAMDSGTIILTGFSKDVIFNSINLAIDEYKQNRKKEIPKEYLVTDTSWRVLKLIMGTVKLSNKWFGIEKK